MIFFIAFTMLIRQTTELTEERNYVDYVAACKLVKESM